MKKQSQILIAGGGIGGLAAALACLRSGCEVRLYERENWFSEVGAGVQLGPNGVRHLQNWGLKTPLEAVAAFPTQLQIRSAVSGRELATLPLAQRAIERYGAPYITIHRADLQSLLLTAVQECPDVQLYLGQTIENHRQELGAVVITTSSGQEVEGDALIGADGLWSRIRGQLLADGPPRISGHLAYRALAHQNALPVALRTTQVTAWLGPHLHAIQYPVRRGELQNFVVILQGTANTKNTKNTANLENLENLEKALSNTCTALQDLVRAIPTAGEGWRLWPLSDRPPVKSAAHMAQGVVALLGDAAHPMRPYLAQGAGMAIEDAAQLEQALAMESIDLPLRLQRYALNRWERNARVQARSERNGRIFHATGPVRWGRDLSLRLFGEHLLDVPWLYQGIR